VRWLAATGGTLAALVLAACAPPDAPDRAVPSRVRNPSFLTVTNAPSAPMLVGSSGGAYVSEDGGRRWSATRPRMTDAVAVTYGPAVTVISRGHGFSIWDMALSHQVRSGTWAWSGNTVALAADPRHGRVWAIATQRGASPRLYFTHNNRRTWFEYPAAFLCNHPRSMAAIAGRRRSDHVRLFVACGANGLQVSDDLGYTFHHVDTGAGEALDVAACQGDPSRVAIVTPDVRVSSDGGLTFRATGLSAVRVAVDPRNPDLIFAIGQNGRLYVSSDGGRTF
jgi:hypothetical protein